MFPAASPPRFSFVFDFDSTLVSLETLDEIISLSLRENHDPKKTQTLMQEIRQITDMGMNGEIDFRTSVKKRLKKSSVSRRHLEIICRKITASITPGLQSVIKEIKSENCDVFILSGALHDCVIPVAKKLGIPMKKVFANQPVFDANGNLTGIKKTELASGEGKTLCIKKLKKSGLIRGKIIIIGDGISDLDPYRRGVVDDFIGFGIHKRRKIVETEAPHFFTSVPSLHRHIRSLLRP